MCNRLQVIISLPVCAAVTYVRHWNNLFLGLSPWRDVMCDTLCMLGEAAVRGLIVCIIKISILNCFTSKYYKNIMICILFGIRIYPYFQNVRLLYDDFKKAQFL